MPSPALAQDGSVSDVLARALERLGCVAAFGILGGAIAPFARAVSRTRIPIVHVRHEGAAGFAAIEASLATGRPALVFATTGPGLTNCVTGMVASRREGAQVVFVTGSTPLDQVGRGAFQETSRQNGLDTIARELVDHSESLRHASELDALLAVLAGGFARPQGFTAHVALPLSVQSTKAAARLSAPAPADDDVERHARGIADAIGGRRLAIWVGFGARTAAAEIRELAERTDAVVIASPRGKGVFPERHPRYLGVTGFGGHDLVARYRAFDPDALLVLGTRLGEMTSFWDTRLVPRAGMIHVDVDASVFGAAFPELPVHGVEADIGPLCSALLRHLPERTTSSTPVSTPPVAPMPPRATGPVRPSALMDAIQRAVVEGSDATVLTEAGNAFAWTTHLLRFQAPGRYRVSTGFGAMGMATAGVVGVALATQRPAVAVVGDGAMLMHQEVSTAVAHRVPAIWIVLNDGRYGMIEQGMRALGWTPFAVELGSHDFVALARAVGADGARVETEVELEAALRQALAAGRPFVVDVQTDPSEIAPFGMRNQNLSRAIATPAPEDRS